MFGWVKKRTKKVKYKKKHALIIKISIKSVFNCVYYNQIHPRVCEGEILVLFFTFIEVLSYKLSLSIIIIKQDGDNSMFAGIQVGV